MDANRFRGRTAQSIVERNLFCSIDFRSANGMNTVLLYSSPASTSRRRGDLVVAAPYSPRSRFYQTRLNHHIEWPLADLHPIFSFVCTSRGWFCVFRGELYHREAIFRHGQTAAHQAEGVLRKSAQSFCEPNALHVRQNPLCSSPCSWRPRVRGGPGLTPHLPAGMLT